MSMKRITAVVLIYVLAVMGWSILGATTAFRSTELFGRLGSDVERLWGTPLVQEAPSFCVPIPGSDQVRWIVPSKSDIRVGLHMDYRKRGLLWYPTYTNSFDATYTLSNPHDVGEKVRLSFEFPAKDGTYDGFVASIAGKDLDLPGNTREGIQEIVELAPGESKEFRIAYRTRGIQEWRYRMDSHAGRVRNFRMGVATGFRKVDYPVDGLSPSAVAPKGNGMDLTWEATDQLTTQDIGIIMPEKLNPGPLTSRITFFAPVCLLFFFVLVATINIIYKVNIHPMHYLFVAAGFFAFHLLLSYMAGLVDIHVSFVVAALVSVVLVTSYLRGALGPRFPWRAAAAGQLFFLVLFSYSFFFQGITGLTVAVGSVVTLAVLMRVTARIDWGEVFRKAPPRTAAGLPEESVPAAARPPALP